MQPDGLFIEIWGKVSVRCSTLKDGAEEGEWRYPAHIMRQTRAHYRIAREHDFPCESRVIIKSFQTGL